MITYVNSEKAKLFEDARIDLGLTQALTIDDYLNNLGTLKTKSPKYVRLPLYEEGHEDEEIFEIDANARAIKVPASFSKNGVGVVSDELAEILWFKINRYFDIKDFGKAANTGEALKDGVLHILIQWEAPDGTNGASWAYAIDISTDPDFVYFGWALTAEHLMAKAGNIKFAVRIMEYDQDGKIAYSFATQAASIAVKAGLSFDVTDEGIEIENVADRIASSLLDGHVAHCPVFAEPDPEDPTDLWGGNLPPYIANLNVPTGAPENTPAQAVLEVSAAAPEGEEYDAIAYKWYKKGANDAEFSLIDPDDRAFSGQFTPALTITSSGEYYVVIFGMNEIVDNEEYVYEGETEAILYTAEEAAAELERATAAEEEPAFVEGDVKVPASAIVTLKKFKYHTSVASSQSTVCEVPAPIALRIVQDVDGVLVLQTIDEVDPALVMLVERQHIGADLVGEVSLVMRKTASAAKLSEQEIADLTDADFSNIEFNAEGITYTVENDRIDIDMANAEEGYYQITVRNSLNGDFEDAPSEVLCRVVKPAEVNGAVASIVDIHGAPVSPKGIANNDKIVATVTINGLSDELDIKWYQVAGGHQDTDPRDPEDKGDDILIPDASGAEYAPTDDGFFYFVATNNVAGTEAKLSSNVVEFTK